MPLSEHEQRILDEIEKRLAAEDPKFARATAVATPRSVARKRIRRSVIGFVLGLVLLIAGLVSALDNANLLLVFGLPAFAVMLGSAVAFARSMRELGPAARAQKGGSWMGRVEEKWRKRTNGDGDSTS